MCHIIDAITIKASSESTNCLGDRISHRYSINKSLKDKVGLNGQAIHADIIGAFNLPQSVNSLIFK